MQHLALHLYQCGAFIQQAEYQLHGIYKRKLPCIWILTANRGKCERPDLNFKLDILSFLFCLYSNWSLDGFTRCKQNKKACLYKRHNTKEKNVKCHQLQIFNVLYEIIDHVVEKRQSTIACKPSFPDVTILLLDEHNL